MSLRKVPVMIDKERSLLFRIPDLTDLGRASGGKSMVEILNRLASIDLDVLILTLQHGLRHEDRRLTREQVADMLQKYVDAGDQGLQPILTALNEAIEASGIISRRRDGAPGEATPA